MYIVSKSLGSVGYNPKEYPILYSIGHYKPVANHWSDHFQLPSRYIQVGQMGTFSPRFFGSTTWVPKKRQPEAALKSCATAHTTAPPVSVIFTPLSLPWPKSENYGKTVSHGKNPQILSIEFWLFHRDP